ncbi:MAG: hypothetical protein IPJ45_04730 [Ignavibacteria bacterium]|nr:hypothetical protein [Ignavibacteria bacterium]
MKTLTIVITVILCVGFTSCEKQQRKLLKCRYNGYKKDTAIKRADTTGFEKK